MATKKNKAETTVAVKEKSARGKKLPAEQRDYEVGNKKPPKEHQFKPGESGNPKGAPIRRINLWPTFCKFMASTDAELAKLDRSELTQAEQTALKLVENAKGGKYSGSERLARYVIDRDEGKAVKHMVVENAKVYTPEQYDAIRAMLRRNLERGRRPEQAADGN